MNSTVGKFATAMKYDIAASEEKLNRLANMDFFILDNSIRESTVGQLRGHTLENKKAIYEQSKKCRMHSIIVATFSHMHRIDDAFCQWLKDNGEDFARLFSFSEVFGGKIVNGIPDIEAIPISLLKNKKYGLYNTILEVDLAGDDIAWDNGWTVDDMCQLIEKWVSWIDENVERETNVKPRVLLNFRDFPAAMIENPERVLKIVEFLANMPEHKRMLGLMYEDPNGESMPDELAAWTRALRGVMNSCGWSDGRLLNHVHEKWEMQTAVTLECLAAGSDGVWASLCVEGAAMGHASSTVTLLNLIRLGNQKVLETYRCKAFRQSAIEVTKLTTTRMPHPTQSVYGERAFDIFLDILGAGDFNLAEFFNEKTENRMTPLASPQMIVDRLTSLFGYDAQFNLDIGRKMVERMLEDLHTGRKEEYQSPCGLALLFDRSGGKVSCNMAEAISKVRINVTHHERFISEIRELWDFWDSKANGKEDGSLDFDSFYHGFLAPYFGCYRCTETRQALQAIDMNSDGYVAWEEFLVYIKWALAQYPETTTADKVVEIAFQKGLIPAMKDEIVYKFEGSSFRSGMKRAQRRAMSSVSKEAKGLTRNVKWAQRAVSRLGKKNDVERK